MKNHAVWVTAVFLAVIIAPLAARAQSQVDFTHPTGSTAGSAPAPTTYTPPTTSETFHHYLSDTFGEFALLGVAATAGIDQINSAPPEWKQGMPGYGRRLASEFGIATISTTARYGLGEALREDTAYYPCQCKGAWPRLSHALVTSFTAHTGAEGHTVFSVPALVAPYVATTAAVYGWYPRRYDAEDALRLGNYYLLDSVAGNIATEFLSNAPHTIFSHLHFGRRQKDTDPDMDP